MFKKIIEWYRNRGSMFLLVEEESSQVVLSKALFKSIQNDHPDDNKYSVLFSKTLNRKGRHDYIFFVNPEWEKHGVSNPNMILTIPITVGKSGHVGFQSVQPTVSEMLAVIGKSSSSTTEFVRLNVKKCYVNEEPYYKILT